MNCAVALWDLDGTIARSEEGIFNSIIYAAEKMGLPSPDRSALRPFIGPPLQYSFEKYFGLSAAEGAKAVTFYREYYSVKGIFECGIYPGVEKALSKLRSAGVTVALATSKPEIYAERILKRFGLSEYFNAVYGADMTPQSSDKSAVVARALKGCAVSDKSRAAMAGDKSHDVIGAKNNGIVCVGALYGYGGRKELEESGADYLAESPEEVTEILLNRVYVQGN